MSKLRQKNNLFRDGEPNISFRDQIFFKIFGFPNFLSENNFLLILQIALYKYIRFYLIQCIRIGYIFGQFYDLKLCFQGT